MSDLRIVNARAARRSLARLILDAKKAPVGIARRGKLAAVLVSPHFYNRSRHLDCRMELDHLQTLFNEQAEQMQSKLSAAAFDALGALSAADVPEAVARARRRLRQIDVNGP